MSDGQKSSNSRHTTTTAANDHTINYIKEKPSISQWQRCVQNYDSSNGCVVRPIRLLGENYG